MEISLHNVLLCCYGFHKLRKVRTFVCHSKENVFVRKIVQLPSFWKEFHKSRNEYISDDMNASSLKLGEIVKFCKSKHDIRRAVLVWKGVSTLVWAVFSISLYKKCYGFEYRNGLGQRKLWLQFFSNSSGIPRLMGRWTTNKVLYRPKMPKKSLVCDCVTEVMQKTSWPFAGIDKFIIYYAIERGV